MNRYHQNHPDPEVRQKYVDWRNAMDAYQARKAGFVSVEAHQETKRIAKETRKNNVKTMLMGVANSAMRAVGLNKSKAAAKKQRTGSNRGS
jgi:hypothetical protein